MGTFGVESDLRPSSVESRVEAQTGTGSIFQWKRIELVEFPAEGRMELWNWLMQFPKANFDDQSPKTLEEFERFFPLLTAGNRQLSGVRIDGALLGAIGFEELSPGLGALRGIIFDKSTHGSGAPLEAVRMLLARAWANGYRKIEAEVFASNRRVFAFLKKLGAVYEGTRAAHALQDGKPIDMRMIAFFPEAL